MHLPDLRRLAISFIFIATTQLHAQPIAEADKQAAIQTIATSIAGNYFDAEKGGQIASYITSQYHDGEFSKANSWDKFDEQVTNSLQRFSKDRHLYVRHNPDVVKTLDPSSTDQGNLNGAAHQLPDYGFTESTILDGNIGYFKLSAIDISAESLPFLEKAMNYLKDTKALIIDLRDNGGGGSSIGPVLESCFLPQGTPLLSFKSRDGSVKTETALAAPTGNMYDKPVYIMINKKTASAAEAFAFTLQQNKRATVFGDRSAGAANMNDYFAVNRENYVSVSTASPALPNNQGSWENKGIVPDIKRKTQDPLTELYDRVRKD